MRRARGYNRRFIGNVILRSLKAKVEMRYTQTFPPFCRKNEKCFFLVQSILFALFFRPYVVVWPKTDVTHIIPFPWRTIFILQHVPRIDFAVSRNADKNYQ